jgi:hypothetical protein
MHRALVDDHNLTEEIYAGISTRHGSMYTVNGPSLLPQLEAIARVE